MKTKKLLFVLFMTMFAVIGCESPVSQPIRIGTNVWLGYESLYVARELSYFNTDQVRLIEYTNTSQVLRAFRNKSIDAAALTLDEALLLTQYNPDIKIVLVLDISHGGDVLIAKPDIKSISELRGRRVGVETTALGAYMLSRALQSTSLTSNDISVIYLPVDEHEAAYAKNRVDAVVTFDPTRSKLLATGAVTLFDSSQIPGEIVDVLVVRDEYIKKQAGNVEHVIQGWFKALSYLKSHPEKAYPLMIPRLQIDADTIKESFKGIQLPDVKQNRTLLGTNDQSINNSIQRLAKIMLDLNLVQKNINTTQIIDASFVNNLKEAEL